MNSIGLIEIGLGQFGQYTEDYMYTGNSLNNMRLIKKKLLIYKDICMYGGQSCGNFTYGEISLSDQLMMKEEERNHNRRRSILCV